MMMRIYLAATLLLLCCMAGAEPVDFEQAKALAARAMGKSEVVEVTASAEVSSRMAVSPVETPAFYLFNSEDGQGFAIVSGDDAFPEILGYSDKGQLNKGGSLPEALVAYLEGYSRYVADYWSGTAVPPLREGVGVADGSAVKPLCTATWGQDYPYNSFCPRIGANICPVGCVATAMAQIMYYHKHPVRATGSVVYNTENTCIGSNGYLVANFDTDEHIYQWGLMRDDASQMQGTANAASRNAVAQLSYDCGVASQMMYAVGGSGTTEAYALAAMHNHFGYSKATGDLMNRDYVSTQAEWNALVKKELDEGRPVLYAGTDNPEGEGDAAGHAFVIDGYDAEGKVHVNWGWDGAANGYFDITTLDMGPYAFALEQSMVFGIKPAVDGEQPMQSRQLVFYGTLQSQESIALVGKTTYIELTDFYNMYAGTKTWNVGVGLFDKFGNFITLVSEDGTLDELDYCYGYSMAEIGCILPSALADGTALADGDYVLRAVINEAGYYLPNGERDWILPYFYGGDAANWLPVLKEGGAYYFGRVSTAIEGIDANGAAEASVMTRQYFDLDGRNITTPQQGKVVIERQTLQNGKIRNVKRVF